MLPAVMSASSAHSNVNMQQRGLEKVCPDRLVGIVRCAGNGQQAKIGYTVSIPGVPQHPVFYSNSTSKQAAGFDVSTQAHHGHVNEQSENTTAKTIDKPPVTMYCHVVRCNAILQCEICNLAPLQKLCIAISRRIASHTS